jgi:hypothetical protein
MRRPACCARCSQLANWLWERVRGLQTLNDGLSLQPWNGPSRHRSLSLPEGVQGTRPSIL